MAGYEILAESFHAHRPLPTGEVAILSGFEYPGRQLVQPQAELIGYPISQSLFQLLTLRFIDDGWFVICLPPGLPFLYFPGAGMITAGGEPDESSVTAQWITFLLDRDGRRPGSCQVRVTKPAPPSWRTCVASRLQISHSLVLESATRDSYLEELQHAQENLAAGNINKLREFELKASPQSKPDTYARLFFGLVWDLLALIADERAESVATGAWRFLGEAPRALRAKAALVEAAIRAFFMPAEFKPDTLRLHALDWMLASRISESRAEPITVIDAISLAHKLWFEAAVNSLVVLLAREGLLHTERASRSLSLALSGDRTARVLRGFIDKAANYLDMRGHIDWSLKLRTLIASGETQPPDETILVRRLRGLRMFTNQGLRESAELLGISSSKASYLLNRKYRNVPVDWGALFAEVKQVEGMGGNTNGDEGSTTKLSELLLSGKVDASVFDNFNSLFAEAPVATPVSPSEGKTDE